MKRAIMLLLIGAICLGVTWAAYQAIAPAEPALSHYVPSGALLYLQAKDFSSLLADWNGSPQKQLWLQSSNYEVFLRSRLLLRLKDAGAQFSAAAGLAPGANVLSQVAGKKSALALFDIGKLQFLYITRLPSANSMQSTLWQTRSKFETRSAGGVSFFFRRDPESGSEVAFAVNGDYLLVATREDLMAGALQLMAGNKGRSLEAEQWWTSSIAASGPAGDLRMVLNLEKIVPSPYFRSYWVQRNITDMKQYSAAVSDLFRSGREYREERVLLKKSASSAEVQAGDGSSAVAELARLIPAQTGFYEVKSNPSAEDCFTVLETKLLASHLGPTPAEKLAPEVQLSSGETGDSADLETRIDQASVQPTASVDSSTPIKDLFQKNHVRAVLQVQSTGRDSDGVFVRIHSAVALLGDSDWNEAAVHSSVIDFVRPGMTAGQLGVEWQAGSGFQQLNGLWNLAVSVRGKYLVISDDSGLLTGMLANLDQKVALPPAIFAAGFDHALERENFVRLTGLLDRSKGGPGGSSGPGHNVDFFSENIASLSSTLAGLSSEKIVIRDAPDKRMQTVTYQWAR